MVVLLQLLKNDQVSQNIFYGFQNLTNDNSLLFADVDNTVKWGAVTGSDTCNKCLLKVSFFLYWCQIIEIKCKIKSSKF